MFPGTQQHGTHFKDEIRIINRTEETFFKSQTNVAHCLSADAKTEKYSLKLSLTTSIDYRIIATDRKLLFDQSFFFGVPIRIDSFSIM